MLSSSTSRLCLGALALCGLVLFGVAGCQKEEKGGSDYYSGKDFQRPGSVARDAGPATAAPSRDSKR